MGFIGGLLFVVFFCFFGGEGMGGYSYNKEFKSITGAYLSAAVADYSTGVLICYVSWDSALYIYGKVLCCQPSTELYRYYLTNKFNSELSDTYTLLN